MVKTINLTHLKRLEAGSIRILRDVAAEAERPVLQYSVGHDSALMLRLARKALAPEMNPPRSACGASPRGGHRQRPGRAGSAAVARVRRIHATRVQHAGMEQLK